jgi:hypothetical protein
MSWQTVEVDPTQVESFGPQYPFAYWLNGKPQMKQTGGVLYTGGWFMPVDNLDTGLLNEEGLPGPGWDHGEMVFESGNDQAGFFAKNIHIAMLVSRRRWIVNGVDGGFAWDDYKGAKASSGANSPRGHMQILGLIKGAEQFGPVFLSAKGMTTKGITNDVFGAFNQNIIAEAANLRSGNRPPFFMFWMSIGPRMKTKDTPDFTVVGSGARTSTITLPCLAGVDGKADADALNKRYVGGELYARLAELRNSADVVTWEKAWDGSTTETEPGPSVSPGWPEDLPPLDEDEMPF